MTSLVDARDVPVCRAFGRAWWKRFGKMIVPAQFGTVQ